MGKKEYVKWIITIPPEKVEWLGWKSGEELESEVRENELILRKKPTST
ncbi:MAG: AbrB/MazE/SpoVT family DNA-binding domain-containing protein [Candidatus Micrarchaeota archaeon]|nr:AbrB/MazE/SpoVT family DNA-binding domain-containing protein [Candidatus Micrarchaeota archaeon]